MCSNVLITRCMPHVSQSFEHWQPVPRKIFETLSPVVLAVVPNYRCPLPTPRHPSCHTVHFSLLLAKGVVVYEVHQARLNKRRGPRPSGGVFSVGHDRQSQVFRDDADSQAVLKGKRACRQEQSPLRVVVRSGRTCEEINIPGKEGIPPLRAGATGQGMLSWTERVVDASG